MDQSRRVRPGVCARRTAGDDAVKQPQSDAHECRRFHHSLVTEDHVRRKFAAPRHAKQWDAVPTCLTTAAHSLPLARKSVIVRAAIDVDRLSGDEASILTD